MLFWKITGAEIGIATPTSRARKLVTLFRMSAAFIAALSGKVQGQAPALSINPMRMELEVNPGAEKTAAFEIRAAPSPRPERGRLVLSLTDWIIKEDGTATYAAPGSLERSASSWITFSPAALTTEPGRAQLVRVTANVPPKAEPGVYRTALFIQERPDAAPPPAGERAIHVRVRYAFTLYVVVPPVSAHPELVNVELDTGQGPPRLVCEMKNTGNGHSRPLVIWSLRHSSSTQIDAKGKIEASVLLPFSTWREPYALQRAPLVPGRYEVSVLVDFQDGKPMQSMTRVFEVAPYTQPPPPPPDVSPTTDPSDGKSATAPDISPTDSPSPVQANPSVIRGAE
jgi:hypothetical protein